jgi:hypothetical protein
MSKYLLFLGGVLSLATVTNPAQAAESSAPAITEPTSIQTQSAQLPLQNQLSENVTQKDLPNRQLTVTALADLGS